VGEYFDVSYATVSLVVKQVERRDEDIKCKPDSRIVFDDNQHKAATQRPQGIVREKRRKL
jgi:hypothetical protein